MTEVATVFASTAKDENGADLGGAETVATSGALPPPSASEVGGAEGGRGISTKRRLRARLVDLSVAALSALALAGGLSVVASVDREHRAARAEEAPATVGLATSEAPLPGLVPAPAARRRVVYVRRSRAS